MALIRATKQERHEAILGAPMDVFAREGYQSRGRAQACGDDLKVDVGASLPVHATAFERLFLEGLERR
jgi:hypothetical protein